jgi:hypothetical protein
MQYLTKLYREFEEKLLFNKHRFLSFAPGGLCRTFVSSMKDNGGAAITNGKH